MKGHVAVCYGSMLWPKHGIHKANFYESGEKAGRQLKKQETTSAIPGIRGNNGKIVISAKEINQVFMDFNKKTQSSALTNWKHGFQTFSSPVSPQSLEASIRKEGVRKAIQSMQSGKAPGLDGFPVEYYKLYIDILAPGLTEVYSESAAKDS